MRLVQEQMKHKAELVELQIAEHERRTETALRAVDAAKQHVDDRSRLFGIRLTLGMFVVLLLLFSLLYTTLQPIVETAAKSAADRINWDERIQAAADASLKERLTADVLAKAVDNDAILKAASSVVDSPEFKVIIRKQAEEAARAAVKSTVDRIVTDTNNFRAIVEEQLRAERDRLQAASATTTPISAADRDELIQKLSVVIIGSEKLGAKWTNVDFYPADDVLHVRARIWWRPEESENERVLLYSLTFEGLSATTADRKEAVAKYVGQASVPASVGVKRSQATSGRRFVAGEFYPDPKARFADFRTMAAAAAADIIALVDDCFETNYPLTCRVQVSR